MKIYPKGSKGYNYERKLEEKTYTKIKAICEHCGKKQIAIEVNYSLNYVACKKCGKEGSLRERI